MTIRITRGRMADFRRSTGEISISLFGHCEEQEDDAGFIVTAVRALRINRRPRGSFHRVATPAIEIIFSTKG